MSIIFITHDLGVVAEVCDEVIVMYAGRVTERSTVKNILKILCPTQKACYLRYPI